MTGINAVRITGTWTVWTVTWTTRITLYDRDKKFVQNFGGNLLGKHSLRRPRKGSEYNIKICFWGHFVSKELIDLLACATVELG
jgi:hypothetical protein